MIYIVGSAVLAVLGLFAMWLLANKHRSGFLLNIICQLFLIPYDTITRQYGFLLYVVVFIPICVRGWLNWKHPSHRAPPSDRQS